MKSIAKNTYKIEFRQQGCFLVDNQVFNVTERQLSDNQIYMRN